MYVIAKFDYQNKQYVIFYENNKINFGFYENDLINKELDAKEIELINEVLENILLSGNYIDNGIFRYNHKEFKIFFDTKTKLKFFFESTPNGLEIPKPHDNSFLNYYFNNELDYVMSEVSKNESNNKNNSFYTRYIKTKVGIIKVAIGAAIALSLISGGEKAYASEGATAPVTIYVSNEIVNDKPFNINEVNNTLFSNPYLSDAEKKFLIEKSQDFILENKEYFDYNNLLDRLSTLKIEYIKVKEEANNVAGQFTDTNNTITMYDCTSFEDCCLSVLLHEFRHSLQNKRIYFDGFSFYETINAIYEREYDGYTIDHYPTLKPYIYTLSQIIPTSSLQKLFITQDPNVLINALKEYSTDEEIIEFIGLMDNIINCENIEANTNSIDTKNEMKLNIADYKTSIELMLNKFYQKKYGKEMYEDNYIKAYLGIIPTLKMNNVLRPNDEFNKLIVEVTSDKNIKSLDESIGPGIVNGNLADNLPEIVELDDSLPKIIALDELNRYLSIEELTKVKTK